MKFKFMSLAAMAACIAFTSCTNDDEPGASKGNVALSQVGVGINSVTNSRAGITATKFSGNEAIGLYLFGGAGVDEATDAKRYNEGGESSKVVEPLNVKYFRSTEFATGENPEHFVSMNPIILSSKVGKLYAYYPYAELNTDKTGQAIPVKVVASQGTGISDGTKDDGGQADYMYGLAVTNLDNNEVSNKITHADFAMNHALTMVTFKFVRDTYPGAGNIKSIKLSNGENKEYLLQGDATMHIGTGAITGGVAGAVYCNPERVLTDLTASAEIPHMLVYPNATTMAAGDVILTIEMDDKTYEINLPHTLTGGAGEAYKWEAGKNYVYTLRMKGYGFGANDQDGSDDIDVTIAEWEEQIATEGDMTKPIN